MGHWLDALAKASTGHRARHRTPSSGIDSAPESGRPDATAAAPSAQGISRRALLRRGAVVGAAVWTTPLLQSAIAPAAAASGPCTVACPVGSPCGTDANCASGLVCSNGVCLIPQGGTGCTDSSQCTSGNCLGGTCLAQWPGTSCTTGSQCLSNKCAGGVCFENPLGGYCQTTADCANNMTCSAETGTCGGTGAACQNNNKCVSGRCRNGVCQ